VLFARGWTITRTGTPAWNRAINSVVYRASSMNQKATSIPTFSLRIRLINVVRQFSLAGSQMSSSAHARVGKRIAQSRISSTPIEARLPISHPQLSALAGRRRMRQSGCLIQ
jgi:hypothetical protein